MTTSTECPKCGQPLPQIMTCEQWKKAGEDLIRQIMQKDGLIKAGYFPR